MKQRGKEESRPKRPPVERIFLVGIGAAVVGYGMYELYKKMTSQNQPSTDIETILPESGASLKQVVVGNDRFPLKRGSKGNNVRLMQAGLQKILGTEELFKHTRIDGDFGPGTEDALIIAGYPTVVTEPIFLSIIKGERVNKSSLSTDPRNLAEQLYKYGIQKDLSRVLSVLGQLKSTSDYSNLNDFFKQVTEEKTLVTSTIVTYLLDKIFKYDESAKEKIRTEFRRIGLLEKSDGRWSLSGIRMYRDIQTLANTFVNDSVGTTILVEKGTILGAELKVSNGMTTFKALDGRLYQVPSRDVIQVR